MISWYHDILLFTSSLRVAWGQEVQSLEEWKNDKVVVIYAFFMHKKHVFFTDFTVLRCEDREIGVTADASVLWLKLHLNRCSNWFD